VGVGEGKEEVCLWDRDTFHCVMGDRGRGVCCGTVTWFHTHLSYFSVGWGIKAGSSLLDCDMFRCVMGDKERLTMDWMRGTSYVL
jgi:hypothetical protein